jgi:redox-sensitive bicupin YhaK (pirin superfamily)
VHVARGRVQLNGQALGPGDAATLDGESRLQLSQGERAEVLVFDLAR